VGLLPQTAQEKKIHALLKSGQGSALSSKNLENLRPNQIPKNAPENIKICSRCDRSFDLSKARQRDFFSLPICNKCTAKGLRPLGHPPHFVWNKFSLAEKERAIEDVGIPKKNFEPFTRSDVMDLAKKDFDDLPKEVRQRLRKKFGIEAE